MTRQLFSSVMKQAGLAAVEAADGDTALKLMDQGSVDVLKQTGGNKAQAARLLQVDYKTLHKKAKEYGISASEDMLMAP